MRVLPRLAIDDYLSALSAKTPAPGGGSAAALAGALGAACALKATAFTVSSAAGPAVSRRIVTRSVARIRAALSILIGNVDADALAYAKVAAARRMPSGTPRLAKMRSDCLRNALAAAAKVPVSTRRACSLALDSLRLAAPYLNKNLATDVACGRRLLDAARLASSVFIEENSKILARCRPVTARVRRAKRKK